MTHAIPDFETVDDKIAAIRNLITKLETLVAQDFTHNEPMKQRIRTYKRWLRELESEVNLNGYC